MGTSSNESNAFEAGAVAEKATTDTTTALVITAYTMLVTEQKQI